MVICAVGKSLYNLYRVQLVYKSITSMAESDDKLYTYDRCIWSPWVRTWNYVRIFGKKRPFDTKWKLEY